VSLCLSWLILCGMARAKAGNRRVINLSLPEGPIAGKYQDFRDNEDFVGHLFVSPYAGSKSTALVDSILKTALDYPGCRLLLTARTLTDAKKSTIPKLQERIGLALAGENKNEAVYTFPEMPHPLTGNPVQSELRAIGVDRVNIEEVMKSTEWFRIFMEEANTIPSDAHDVLLARARQFVFHRSMKVEHMVLDSARLWGIKPSDAYTLMRDSLGSPVHQFKLEMTDPMPGKNLVKAVMNPHGNDHVWLRYVGIPFPDGGVTREWAQQHIGIREYFFTKSDRDEVMVPLILGNWVVDQKGERGYVREVDGNKVTLMDGVVRDDDELELIMQLYTTYGFPDENWSRNYANHQSSLLMVNRGLRKRTFAGIADVRSGLVFPNFINRYVEDGGHIMPYPEGGLPAGYSGIGGVDQGGNHATAGVAALLTKETNTAIVFYEYLKSGVSAKQSAYEINSSMPKGMNIRWFGDPKMWSRDYTENTTSTHAQKYMDAGLTPFEPGKKGDEAFDDVMDALEFIDSFVHRKRQAHLYVFDNCEQLIHAMSNLTWDDVRHGRHKWIVDMGDALKLMIGGLRKSAGASELPMPVGRRIFSEEFAY